MTAMTPVSINGAVPRSIRFATVQARLSALLVESGGSAGWWVEVTRHLDDLAETVHQAPGDLVDVDGFAEQIRADAPHLLGRWTKLAGERERLIQEVAAVRRLAGGCAGDPGAVAPVNRAIRDVLARVRRFQERTTEVLLDAYERDMGGEH